MSTFEIDDSACTPFDRVGRRSAGTALYVGVALAATMLGMFVLGLWGTIATVPVTYSADGILHSALIKGIVDHRQFYTNPGLGAPGVFQFYDFPAADAIFVSELWLLSLFTRNYVLVLNLFALLSYPLVALSAAWAIRRLGFSRAAAFVFALLYAVLPFHQSRAAFHLYLAAYFSVPLAIALVAEVGFGKAPVLDGRGRLERSLGGVPLWGWLVAAVVAMSGVYYAFFCLVLLVAAGLLTAFAKGDWRRIIPPAIVCAVLVSVLAVQYVPSYLYWQKAGKNSLAQRRAPSDSDLFGLRMTGLVFPMTNHRFAPLARIKSLYMSSLAGITEKYRGIANDSSLGLVGVFGFFVLIFWAVASPLRGPPNEPRGAPPKLAVMGLVAFLLATVGGVGGLIAYLGFPQIRAYDRMTVYLGFLSLCAAAWVADATARKISASSIGSARIRTGIVVACFAGVLLLGLLDQTSPAMVPDNAATKAMFDNDRAFVAQVEAAVPEGSSIFQLPYVSFPESPAVGKTGGYDELRMYLHSKNLRWSAGSFMGRPDARWQQQVSEKAPEVMIQVLRVKGFAGIVVDRYGYADGGRKIEASIEAAIGGSAPIVSPDGRYAFYSIVE